MVHQEDSSCAWYVAHRGGLRGSAPFPMLSRGKAFGLRPPPFYFSLPPGSRPRSRCFPCVLHPPVVHCWCATGTGSTRRTRCVLCLPMQTLRALLTRWVIRAHTSHLVATCGPQHSPDRLIRHAALTGDVTERFPLLDTLEHGFPGRGRDLPARIRCGLRVVRQRQKPRIVKGRGERIFSG